MAFSTRPPLRGTFGMASSTHWLASQTAMAVLERGGHTFDAAVAGGFVLQVVEPHLNGLGGEVPIILWDASARKLELICSQGPAPFDATIERVRSMGLDAISALGVLFGICRRSHRAALRGAPDGQLGRAAPGPASRLRPRRRDS